RNGKELAVLSKQLATIITELPVEFNEDEFRIREADRETLTEIFAELEFKTLGKRILGDEFNVFNTAPAGVQTDLFGNAVATPPAKRSSSPGTDDTQGESAAPPPGLHSL